jgi:hypothetical protein
MVRYIFSDEMENSYDDFEIHGNKIKKNSK